MQESNSRKALQQELKSGLGTLRSHLAQGTKPHHLPVLQIVHQLELPARIHKINPLKCQLPTVVPPATTSSWKRRKNSQKTEKYKKDFSRCGADVHHSNLSTSPEVIYCYDASPSLEALDPESNTSLPIELSSHSETHIDRPICEFGASSPTCLYLTTLKTTCSKRKDKHHTKQLLRRPKLQPIGSVDQRWILGHSYMHEIQQELSSSFSEQAPFYSRIIYQKMMVYPIVKALLNPITDRRQRLTNHYMAKRKSAMDAVRSVVGLKIFAQNAKTTKSLGQENLRKIKKWKADAKKSIKEAKLKTFNETVKVHENESSSTKYNTKMIARAPLLRTIYEAQQPEEDDIVVSTRYDDAIEEVDNFK